MVRARIQRKSDWVLSQVPCKGREDVIDFFQSTIWKNKDAGNLYSWKYEKNPKGITTTLFCKNGEGEIVAGAFFMPWKFAFDNKVITALQWVDMFVELSYRGQPIAAEMLKTYNSLNAEICFAFPNTNGLAVHKKNNGLHLGCIMRYTKPLDFSYIVSRFIKNPFFAKAASFLINACMKIVSPDTYLFLRDYSIVKADDIGEGYDIFWNKFKDKHRDVIFTDRNAAYMKWKYIDGPCKKRSVYFIKRGSRVEGFIVLEEKPEAGFIVDLAAESAKALSHLIAYAVKHFRRLKKKSLSFIALEKNLYFNRLKRFGFVERPDKTHFYIYPKNSIKEIEGFSKPDKWFITIGDCDIDAL
ncbi:MAG: hypothetical protein ABH872_02930 [Candidatus Omnitrophota bacterium]